MLAQLFLLLTQISFFSAMNVPIFLVCSKYREFTPENGWLEDLCFLAGVMLVSGSVSDGFIHQMLIDSLIWGEFDCEITLSPAALLLNVLNLLQQFS